MTVLEPPDADLLARFRGTVGEQRFDDACAAAWATAAGTGHEPDHRGPEGDAFDVFWELEDSIDEAWGNLDEPVGVALALYATAPSYTNTTLFVSRYGAMTPGDREQLWAGYRAALDAPDPRLADPVGYSLWVDFFEDAATVEQAWAGVTGALEPGSRREVRLLALSGPVPWALKAELLRQAAADEDRHPSVAAALVGARFDVYGQIDEVAARELLGRLTGVDDVPGVGELRAKLG